MSRYSFLFRVFVILALLLPLSARPVSAAIITVTNTNNAGDGSLRQAILDANAGDTITFEAGLSGGTISLDTQLEVNKNITITAFSLAEDIILSGKDAVRVLFVGLKGDLYLQSVVIEDGYAAELDALSDSGGGIYNRGILELNYCVVRDNASFSTGGGLYNDNGTVVISGSSFTGNSAQSYGGAIANYGTLTLTGSTVEGNSGTVGGGIFNSGSLTTESSVVTDNEASITGGGIRNSTGGTLTMHLTDVTYNTAEQSGGGIQSSGVFDISDSLIAHNTVSEDSGIGGGIVSSDETIGHSHILSDSAISHNQSGGHGGGISNENGMLQIEDCTMVNNSTTHASGGAIYNASGMIVLITGSALSENHALLYGGGIRNFGIIGVANSTLYANTGEGGGAISNWGRAVLIHATLSGNTSTTLVGTAGGFDNIQTNAEATFINTIIANSTGNDCNNNSGGEITSESVDYLIEDGSCGATYSGDPLLSRFAYYGGPASTLALGPGSPAIDRGKAPASPYTIDPVDQRGVGRPQGDGWDLGAYEYDLYEIRYFPLIVR